MSDMMKLQKLNPNKIEIPDVRCTSIWDDDLLEMFRESVANEGIQEPILILKEDETFWLVDGLHRLHEAKDKGYKTVDCAVVEGTLDEVYTKNLMTNRLKGKVKVTEEIAVINKLFKDHDYTIEKIVEKTGYRQERVEQMLNLGRCRAEVIEALDEDKIKVCHAYQLSRLVDASTQLRLLQEVIACRPTCRQMKMIIDDALQLITEMRTRTDTEAPLGPPPIPTAHCHYCGGEYDVRQMMAPPTCPGCYGFLMASVSEVKKQRFEEAQKVREISEKVISVEDEAGEES
jgi:ParB family chromosome partitioning protein